MAAADAAAVAAAAAGAAAAPAAAAAAAVTAPAELGRASLILPMPTTSMSRALNRRFLISMTCYDVASNIHHASVTLHHRHACTPLFHELYGNP